MRTLSASVAALSAAAFALAAPVNADGLKSKLVVGVQDSQTGAFRPLNRVVPDAASTVATTGTVEVTFNIKLVSSFKKGSLLTCFVDLSGGAVNESTDASTYYDEEASDGVDISGTTATCSVKVPYSWLLPTGSSSSVIDSFNGGYTVGVNPTTSGSLTGLFDRSSTGSFVSSSKIPASGSISKYTVNVTL